MDDTSVTNSYSQDTNNSPGKILSSDIKTFKVEQTMHDLVIWAPLKDDGDEARELFNLPESKQ